MKMTKLKHTITLDDEPRAELVLTLEDESELHFYVVPGYPVEDAYPVPYSNIQNLMKGLHFTDGTAKSQINGTQTVYEITFYKPRGVCLATGHLCSESYPQDELHIPMCSSSINTSLMHGLAAVLGLRPENTAS
jgi:hypothetical protein